MIVSVHQPHFLPWLGYFNKIANSDVFVWLHNVQFRKNYYQNRVKIKGTSGNAQWLTVPVHASLESKIDEVTLADPEHLGKIASTVEHCYARASYMEELWLPLREVLQQSHQRLDPLNRQLFDVLMEMLEFDCRVVRAGEIEARDDPTLRLIDICRHLGADAYLAGAGSRKYLDVEAFEKHSIQVIWQNFIENHPVYDQLRGDFIPGLSIVDTLFNVGVQQTRQLIGEAWQARPERSPNE